MVYRSRPAKINIKVLIILVLAVVALGASLFSARHIRRAILSKRDLLAGEAAYEKKDWPAANRHFAEYLGRNPDDVEILKKLAEARLSIRPLEPGQIAGAIGAYRRVIQLDPQYETAYEKLAMIYTGIGNFAELAYIARARLDQVASDREARLWLADALVQLDKTEEARERLHDLIAELKALPEKHVEYVHACIRMSSIAESDKSAEAKTALEWLNDAVAYNPESVEALGFRARLYRETPEISGLSGKDRLAKVRADLEAADAVGTDNPRLRLSLGIEWMAIGELDLAAAELEAAEAVTQEALEEHFSDVNDWVVSKFLFGSELAMRRGATDEAISDTNDTLAALKEKVHRVRVLPSAINVYAATGRVSEARDYLDEYLDASYSAEATAEAKLQLATLEALVAKVEGRPYAVIDVLQPVVVSDALNPKLWRLLAEAYSETDQTRRAVSALMRYRRLRPEDPAMTLQLAKEYVKLQDWKKASEITRLAELLNPTEITAKLLRIQASIHLAAAEPQGIDRAKLDELSGELGELRKENADRVDIRIMQAVIAVYLDQPEEAEKELKLAIDECEDSLNAELQLAGHYNRTKRTAEAVNVCQRACEKHPEVAEPWLSLSGLHVANGDYDSARDCLRQGMDTVVDQREKRSLSLRLAVLELTYADRDTGISILRELAAQDKEEIRARLLLLGTREVRTDAAAAEKLVKELKKAEGESGLQWRMHEASLWLSSDDWRSKQQDITDKLQYCIDSDPEWSAPVLLLVGMYERLNDSRRVEDICRQALTRNRSATGIANKLLTLLEKEGRLSEAEKVLEQIEADTRFASVWHVRAALSTGDSSRAIDELKLTVSNDDRDAESRILLARLVYSQTRDANQAFEYLEEAEAIAPGSITLTAAKVAILKAEGQTEEAERMLDEYVVNTDTFGAYMMRAGYLANKGEFASAEKDYRKLTTFAEQGAMGYGLLGDFYGRNEKLDEAVEAFEEGLEAYPDDVRLKRALMQLLFVRAQAADRERALEILSALEEKLPEDVQLMGLRALQMLKESTPESVATAREKLEDIIKLEPMAVDAHVTLIRIAMQQGDFETARNLSIRAIGSNPKNLALLSARGKVELALENTQMAVELGHLVLREDPNHADARDVIVQAALKSRDRNLLEEARALLQSASMVDTMDEKLLLSRTRDLIALGLHEVAIPELEAYCETKEGSSSVNALLSLHSLYRLAGDIEQSDRKIEQAERLDPNNLSVVHTRFLWLIDQKRFEELAQISSAYLSTKEQNLGIFLAAASILSAQDSPNLKKEGLKLYEHAENAYRELLEQNPNDVGILNNLAWTLQEHGQRYTAALELANRGLSIAPDDLHLLDTRGTILMNLAGRLVDARKDFRKLAELSPSGTQREAKTLLKLGRICAKLNDLVEAKEHLGNALEIDRKIDVFTDEERSEITRIIESGGAESVDNNTGDR